MDPTYLVSYTCSINTPAQVDNMVKSISFSESRFRDFRTLGMITHAINKQTGDWNIQILAITPLHKIFEHARETKEDSRTSAEIGH